LVELRRAAGEIEVSVPNLLKYRDEYARKSGHSPDIVRHKKQRQIQIQIQSTEASPREKLNPEGEAPPTVPQTTGDCDAHEILTDEPPVQHAGQNPKAESGPGAWFTEEFWVKGVVWQKIGYGAARKAWLTKVKTRAVADVVIEAARKQGPEILQHAATNGHSVLHPATWLNQERWKDEPGPPQMSLGVAVGRPMDRFALHDQKRIETFHALMARRIPNGE
jgi:hypothetical protein